MAKTSAKRSNATTARPQRSKGSPQHGRSGVGGIPGAPGKVKPAPSGGHWFPGLPTGAPKIRPPRKKPAWAPGAPVKPKRAGKPRWRETIKKPEGYKQPTLGRLPPGCEAWIAVDESTPAFYPLNRATAHTPDHVHDSARDYWVCHHPKNSSSWIACIGLVVLNSGKLGLYFRTWKGFEAAYVWPKDDDCIYFYQLWRREPSKGKAIKGKFGPSWFWAQPYVTLSS